jgi:hypothetical protein
LAALGRARVLGRLVGLGRSGAGSLGAGFCGIGRRAAVRGVRERLDGLVCGRRAVFVPAQFLRSPGGRRAIAGVRLLGFTPGSEDALAAAWSAAGYPVSDQRAVDGRLLTARDPAGYLLTLAQAADADPILTVTSPSLQRSGLRRRR